jgi:lipopolysaccharide transport system permease protein
MATAVLDPATSTDVRRTLELIRMTATRALKVRYRGTALGVLWSFANPVLMTVVYTAIFGTAFSRYYDGSVFRYLVSAFVGMVVVTLFLNATSEALSSIVANGQLLNKIALPPMIFPVSTVLANVFQHAVTTFPIVLTISIFATHDPVRVLLVPVVLGALVLLIAGFSLALSALFVFFRDLPHLWSIVGFILWMTSPLFYPIEFVPAAVRPYYDLNPIGQMVTALREVTIQTGPLHLRAIVIGAVSGIVALGVGLAIFNAMRRDFMDLL